MLNESSLRQSLLLEGLSLSAKIVWLLSLSILGWGLWLRIAHLGTHSFWMDEAFSIELAYRYLEGIRGFSISSLNLLENRGPVFHSLLSLVIKTAGESEFSMRAISLFSGLGLVLIVALFSRRYFGYPAALIALFLCSFDYWQIAWSRQAREYMLLTLIVWAGLFVIHWLWSSPQSRWLKVMLITLLVLVATGVHLFGAILLLGVCLKWAVLKVLNETGVWRVLGGAAIAALVLIPLASLRVYFGMLDWYFDIYLGFIIKTYWPLFIPVAFLSVVSLTQVQKEIVLWLCAVSLIGLLYIGGAVPMVNLRYVFFLMPILYILAAVGLAGLAQRSMPLFYLAGGLYLLILLAAQSLVIMPRSEYELESHPGRGDFVYYTPQPDFRAAYDYIDTRLGEIDLITPYPALSRRYRSRDDTMAINASIDYQLAKKTPRFEPYTGVLYMNAAMAIQFVEQIGEAHILIDTHAMQRIPGLLKNFIAAGDLVESWERPPYSDLYLYRLSPLSFE